MQPFDCFFKNFHLNDLNESGQKNCCLKAFICNSCLCKNLIENNEYSCLCKNLIENNEYKHALFLFFTLRKTLEERKDDTQFIKISKD